MNCALGAFGLLANACRGCRLNHPCANLRLYIMLAMHNVAHASERTVSIPPRSTDQAKSASFVCLAKKSLCMSRSVSSRVVVELLKNCLLNVLGKLSRRLCDHNENGWRCVGGCARLGTRGSGCCQAGW